MLKLFGTVAEAVFCCVLSLEESLPTIGEDAYFVGGERQLHLLGLPRLVFMTWHAGQSL